MGCKKKLIQLCALSVSVVKFKNQMAIGFWYIPLLECITRLSQNFFCSLHKISLLSDHEAMVVGQCDSKRTEEIHFTKKLMHFILKANKKQRLI